MIRTAMTAELAGTLSPVTVCSRPQEGTYEYRRYGIDASIRLRVGGAIDR